jgi:hypothetical protein
VGLDVKDGAACAEQVLTGYSGEGAPSLRHAVHHLLMATKQVAMAGTEAQRQRATELLDETRRKIYSLLASDEA